MYLFLPSVLAVKEKEKPLNININFLCRKLMWKGNSCWLLQKNKENKENKENREKKSKYNCTLLNWVKYFKQNYS